MTNKMDIDVTGILSASGAINSVYLVPSQERTEGEGPLVCVFGAIGSGVPERAYHQRWHYIGKVSPDAVSESVEATLRRCEGAMLALDATYQGKEWDGHNHVGRWLEDERLERELLDIREALSEVSTYWAASDYFAPLGDVDSRMRELATLDSLDEVVEREMKNTGYDGMYLDEADVRKELLSDARMWLDRHGDTTADSDDERELRARLAKWIEA